MHKIAKFMGQAPNPGGGRFTAPLCTPRMSTPLQPHTANECFCHFSIPKIVTTCIKVCHPKTFLEILHNNREIYINKEEKSKFFKKNVFNCKKSHTPCSLESKLKIFLKFNKNGPQMGEFYLKLGSKPLHLFLEIHSKGILKLSIMIGKSK